MLKKQKYLKIIILKKINRENFEEVVFNPEHDVIVEFYAEWCDECERVF